ncbi:hypothetical protein HYU06_02105 [Candidatus Woesearchaeota archaeon]|nr:hypothetical protein [Candidatus Woesearchaeota archaeon]
MRDTESCKVININCKNGVLIIPRGRPVHSVIRQNIVEILYFLQKGYGYDIYRIYCDLFPKVTLRSIYYHLRKGVSLEELKIEKVAVEHGDYSWGTQVEKIYYSLGKNAQPKLIDAVKRYFEEKIVSKKSENKITTSEAKVMLKEVIVK